jgi:hypothetical protein
VAAVAAVLAIGHAIVVRARPPRPLSTL